MNTKNGFIQVPKIGSFVLTGLIENSEGDHYITMYSDIEEVILVQNDKETLKIESSGNILFHGGKTSGLIDAKKLVKELDKNNQILQQILSVITGAPVNEPGNGSPSALQITLKARLTGKALGSFSGIENDRVKH